MNVIKKKSVSYYKMKKERNKAKMLSILFWIPIWIFIVLVILVKNYDF